MAERIRWTPDEIEAIKDRALEYLRANPGAPIYRAVAEGQKDAVGEDRIREIYQINAVPPKLREAIESALGGIKTVSEDRFNEVVEELNKTKQIVKEQRAYINTLEARPKPRTESEILKEFCTDVLAGAMRRSQAPELGAAMASMETVADAVQRQRHDPEPSSGEGPRIPKVVVVGPMREQTQELLTRYEGKLKLKVFTSGEMRGRTGDVANGSDKVVFWTKFAGHDVFHGLPRDKVVMAPTWQTIIEVLDDIYKRSVQ